MTERHVTAPEPHAEGIDQAVVHRDPGRAPAGEAPTIGIATATPEEFAAMRLFVDDPEPEYADADLEKADAEPDHVSADPDYARADHRPYVVGSMPSFVSDRPHRVVLALLGGAGNDSAAAGCANLARGFGSVDQIIMCGVAAGIPDQRHHADRVRLGDVVVATWGIVDLDHLVETRQPSQVLTRAADVLKAAEYAGELPWLDLIEAAVRRSPSLAPPRASEPRVHHGRIGSVGRSVRDARLRDRLAEEHDVLAVELEGEGVGDAGGLGSLVVRGVGGFPDEPIDRRWRPYAALAAAAYVRCLLRECPAVPPRGGR